MGLGHYRKLYHRQSGSRCIYFSSEVVADLLSFFFTQPEPQAPNYIEVFGIAQPLDSMIAVETPVTSNGSDRATWASNLSSINFAPSFHFLSLARSCPGPGSDLV